MLVPDTMCGVYLTRHGGPDALEWRTDIPVPQPRPNEALVRVLAAGVNNTDINTRIGWYASDVTGATEDAQAVGEDAEGGWSGALRFPRIQGGDLCGEVVALGAEVSGLSLGQRVTCPINQPRPSEENPVGFEALGSEFDGAFAEYCAVNAADLYDVTVSPLSDIEIAAIPTAFGTAAGLLHRAGVESGHEVLVTGASGGVGLAAVQLAQIRGATVTGISSSAKAQMVRDAGAAEVLDRSDPIPESTFDVVIDVVGGAAWQAYIDSLKPGGHYAVAGAIGGPIVSADLRGIYLRDITIHGCTYQSPAVFEALIDMVNAGTVRPLVSGTYPMRDIARAQEDFQSKRFAGKLVLLPPKGAETDAP